jgi:protein-L-isoaspartate(D-aspartate) O-methyltransferase
LTDIVSNVAATIDYDQWVMTAEGHQIPQSTTASVVHRMIGLLDVEPGMRVMEVGTGSGYSGAVLSNVVGADGLVVSLDVDDSLVERARALHRQASHTNINVLTSDGFRGWPDAAPYDRIIGWATPHVLPKDWVEQAKPGATIVTPVKIASVAGANATIRAVVSDGVRSAEFHHGYFIEMAPEVITELGLPVRFVDAVHRPSEAQPWWISGPVFRDRPKDMAQKLLDQLVVADSAADFFDLTRDSWRGFTAFVLASTDYPASVGSSSGLALGVATTDSLAVSLPNGGLLACGTGEALDELAAYWQKWRDQGEPGLTDLSPKLTQSEDGWLVRPSVA